MPAAPPNKPPDWSLQVAYGRRPSPFGIVAWSPDGKWLAAASGAEIEGDGQIWLWANGEGEPIQLQGHEGSITSIAWSPHGQRLASGSDDHTIRVWDPAASQALSTLHGHQRAVRTVAWSPDGERLASGSIDKTVRLWNPVTGKALHTLLGHTDYVLSVAWSPNGQRLASGSEDRTVRLWDPRAGNELYAIKGHRKLVLTIAWSPDGQRLAIISDDHDVRLWDSASLNILHTLSGYLASARSVAWSPNGQRLAIGYDDHTVRLFDPASGKALCTLSGHQKTVRTLSWSPDGQRLASGSDDETVRLWDPNTGKSLYTLSGHRHKVVSVAWSPVGQRLASGSFDETVRLWAASPGQLIHTLNGRQHSVLTVAWSPDGQRLACGLEHKDILVCDSLSGKGGTTFEGHKDYVRSVAWSGDGDSLASGSRDRTVRIWRSASRTSHVLLGHRDYVRSVAFSPDGSYLASGSDDDCVFIWDATSGQRLQVLSGHRDYVRDVAWSPDSKRLASASDDKSVALWSPSSDSPILKLHGHDRAAVSVAWSPDGQLLASGSNDRTVRLWDPSSGEERRVLEGHTSAPTLLAWSSDGCWLASASATEVRVWDTQAGDSVAKFPAYGIVPAGLVFDLPPVEWGSGAIRMKTYRSNSFHSKSVAITQAKVTTAKVVLAGNSEAGKTSLARRLVHNTYEDGQPTTHGMQVWKLPPESLHPGAKAPQGHERELFLWDLGGQPEYQLVNQLFLNNTHTALVLFDGATRGPAGLQPIEEWDERLCARVDPQRLRKILVRTKADQPGIVHDDAIEAIRQKRGFEQRHYAISAKENTGIGELKTALHHAIAWDRLAEITRPAAWQAIRNHVQALRDRGRILVYLEDLRSSLAGLDYTDSDLRQTIIQLDRGGEIVDVELASGDRVLLLRIDVVSRYAGSLIQAARRQPVPSLEQDRLLSKQMDFPGLDPVDRLPRDQERVVVEAVARLLVERGLCFDHQRLLVFPTLFSELAPHEGSLPPSAPIYYDFNGPIDNIYAGLVARLQVSQRFGDVRLWRTYAEFGAAENTFGLRRADKSKGRGHLDLIFGEQTTAEQRGLFRTLVDDHLREQGVNVLDGRSFECDCRKFTFSEETVRERLADAHADVGCPKCDRRYTLLPEPPASKDLAALKTEIKRQTQRDASQVVHQMASVRETEAPLQILHLSDLHFTGETNLNAMLQPLEQDLRSGELNVERLDYLVLSGDFADRCTPAGWERAKDLLNELMNGFRLSAERVILCPGNHDYAQNKDDFEYDWKHEGTDKDGQPIVRAIPKPGATYPKRFHRFANFYHSHYVTRPWEDDPDKQFHLKIDDDTDLGFLALNSAWQVDQFNPLRASLNNNALKAALRQPKQPKLGIAVWHHAIAGDRKIADTEAIKSLAQANYRLVLHGDVHVERDDIQHHLDPQHKIHVIGGGAFGAESQDRLYTLLRIARDLKSAEIIRRRQRKPTGPYEPYAIYPTDQTGTRRHSYTINF